MSHTSTPPQIHIHASHHPRPYPRPSVASSMPKSQVPQRIMTKLIPRRVVSIKISPHVYQLINRGVSFHLLYLLSPQTFDGICVGAGKHVAARSFFVSI
jgi:hypothetical protein